MNTIEANKLLEQMRAMASEVNKSHGQLVDQKSGPSFSSAFKDAVLSTNDIQMQAGNMATRYEQGDPSVKLHEVMIALQKSNVSFQAITQVRNRLVNAYQDIMNMPI